MQITRGCLDTAKGPNDWFTGDVRAALAAHDGRQAGDPVKGAKAIIDITEVPEPPLRLALGADAVGRIEGKLDLVRRELDRWRHVTLSTDI